MKTKPKQKMNVKLLRRIQRAIMAEPARMDMRRWAVSAESILCPGFKAPPPCGTVGCIAGWGLLLTKGKRNKFLEIAKKFKRRTNFGIETEAGNLFGITEEQRQRLFHTESWPQPFRDRQSHLNEGTLAYARVVCRRIDHFIETGE